MTRFQPKSAAFWPVIGVVALGDFVSKRMAESALLLHTPEPVLGDFVRLTLTYNTGAAMNVSLGGFSRVGFSALAVTMIVVLYRMYRSAPARDLWQCLALGLIAGGALGNLLDRLRSARGVVDFIDIGTSGWRFYTFNVADTAVTTGAILLALTLLRRTSKAPGAVVS